MKILYLNKFNEASQIKKPGEDALLYPTII